MLSEGFLLLVFRNRGNYFSKYISLRLGTDFVAILLIYREKGVK
ncbi:Uncharacterised protein [Streptococcus suis]|uniref:Uncharacterized protein n=1 Tax=Streptococcus suis TaxID=1307 RepID=A0A123U104_STRSU|nr:Uncharacterised protein [Streptococcus suis]CYV87830.1 Uncharacterised protein [Streptococcus suis]